MLPSQLERKGQVEQRGAHLTAEGIAALCAARKAAKQPGEEGEMSALAHENAGKMHSERQGLGRPQPQAHAKPMSIPPSPSRSSSSGSGCAISARASSRLASPAPSTSGSAALAPPSPPSRSLVSPSLSCPAARAAQAAAERCTPSAADAGTPPRLMSPPAVPAARPHAQAHAKLSERIQALAAMRDRAATGSASSGGTREGSGEHTPTPSTVARRARSQTQAQRQLHSDPVTSSELEPEMCPMAVPTAAAASASASATASSTSRRRARAVSLSAAMRAAAHDEFCGPSSLAASASSKTAAHSAGHSQPGSSDEEFYRKQEPDTARLLRRFSQSYGGTASPGGAEPTSGRQQGAGVPASTTNAASPAGTVDAPAQQPLLSARAPCRTSVTILSAAAAEAVFPSRAQHQSQQQGQARAQKNDNSSSSDGNDSSADSQGKRRARRASVAVHAASASTCDQPHVRFGPVMSSSPSSSDSSSPSSSPIGEFDAAGAAGSEAGFQHGGVEAASGRAFLLPFIDRPSEVRELLFGQRAPRGVAALADRIKGLFPERSDEEGDTGAIAQEASEQAEPSCRAALECVLYAPRDALPDAAWLRALRSLIGPRSEEAWARLAEVLGAELLTSSEWEDSAAEKGDKCEHEQRKSATDQQQEHVIRSQRTSGSLYQHQQHHRRARSRSMQVELLPDVPEEWTVPQQDIAVDALKPAHLRARAETLDLSGRDTVQAAGVRISTLGDAEDDAEREREEQKEEKEERMHKIDQQLAYFDYPPAKTTAAHSWSPYDYHFPWHDAAATPVARAGGDESEFTSSLNAASKGNGRRRTSFALSFEHVGKERRASQDYRDQPEDKGHDGISPGLSDSISSNGKDSDDGHDDDEDADADDFSSIASSTASLSRRADRHRHHHRSCDVSEAGSEGKCGMAGCGAPGRRLSIASNASATGSAGSGSAPASCAGSEFARNDQGNVVEGLLPDGRTRHPTASAAAASATSPTGSNASSPGVGGTPGSNPVSPGRVEAFRRAHRLSDASELADERRKRRGSSGSGSGGERRKSSGSGSKTEKDKVMQTSSHAPAPQLKPTDVITPVPALKEHDYAEDLTFGTQSKDRPVMQTSSSGFALGGGFSLRRTDVTPKASLNIAVSSPPSPNHLLSPVGQPGSPHIYRRPGGFLAFSREYNAHRRRQRALSSGSILSETQSTGSQAVASSECSTLADEEPHRSPLGNVLALSSTSDVPAWSPTQQAFDLMDDDPTPRLNAPATTRGFDWSPCKAPADLPQTEASVPGDSILPPLTETHITSSQLQPPASPSFNEADSPSDDDGNTFEDQFASHGASDAAKIDALAKRMGNIPHIIFPVPPSPQFSRAADLSARLSNAANNKVLDRVKSVCSDEALRDIITTLSAVERADMSDLELLEYVAAKMGLVDLTHACKTEQERLEVEATVLDSGYRTRWLAFEGLVRAMGLSLHDVCEAKRRCGPPEAVTIQHA